MFGPRRVPLQAALKTWGWLFQEYTVSPATGRLRKILFNQKQTWIGKRDIDTDAKTLGAKTETAPLTQPLGKLEQKMKLMFTCKRCKTRNSKIITKLGYEKGVVIVRCDGCKNNHLIADNLGWFGDVSANRNVERILAERGETVRRIRDNAQGCIEAIEEIEYRRIALEKLEPKKNESSEQVLPEKDESPKS